MINTILTIFIPLCLIYLAGSYYYKYKLLSSTVSCENLGRLNPRYKLLDDVGIFGLTNKRQFKSKEQILTYYENVADGVLQGNNLVNPIRYTTHIHTAIVKVDRRKYTITIPKYFVYDGETIGIFQRFAARGSATASLMHDYLYYIGNFTRLESDLLLIAIMKYRDVSQWRRFIVYVGVRLFGGSSYWGVVPK